MVEKNRERKRKVDFMDSIRRNTMEFGSFSSQAHYVINNDGMYISCCYHLTETRMRQFFDSS